MKNLTTFLSSIIAVLGFGVSLNAQCPAGQSMVTIDVTTDDWGYECYWELTPQGSACGVGTLASFGNTAEIGCAGGGLQVATAGGYANNTTTTETLGCVPTGTCYSLHYVDDWGDGGATFEVFIDGVLSYTFVGTGTGGVFDACVVAPAAFDAAVTAVGLNEYPIIPLAHATTIALGAEVSNNGTSAMTNVVVNAEVLLGVTPVNTASSTPIANMAPGASQSVTMASYAPTAQGVYTIEYTADIAEVDGNAGNDMLSTTVTMSDTVMARESGVVTGALGIGAPNENGRLGQTFTPGINDNVTSATAQFNTPTDGDVTEFMIYTMVGGVPTTMVAQTAQYTFTAADATNGVTVTLPFTTPVAVTAGTEFLLCVTENAANVTLATSTEAVVPGTNFVTWDSNPNGAGVWSNSEDFGFNVQYVLRANFGQSGDASIAEQAFNVGVYPNPTSDVVTLDVPAELVGNVYVVFDQAGRVVTQGTLDNVSTKVDMNSFDNGMYIVKIDAGNVTLNVVKQ